GSGETSFASCSGWWTPPIPKRARSVPPVYPQAPEIMYQSARRREILRRAVTPDHRGTPVSKRPIAAALDHVRKAASLQEIAGLTAGQLLECYVTGRDEAAFEALVRRHGPMVLGVCRRVLHNVHDAEDAFQATFLVLVRKAASIVPREAVGGWLHGAAHLAAL